MRIFLVAIGTIFIAGCATTGGSGVRETWVAQRTDDPITGQSRCTVIAPDRSFGRSYTRTLMLYPFVEQNSEIGLIVGVSSGGTIRVPPGDIQWRVDQNPHRVLRQAETPVIGDPTSYFDASSLTPEVQAVLESSQQMNAGLMSSIQNGITAVDGQEASDALAEMLTGSSLLFRAANAAPAAGVPSQQTFMTGQIRDGRLEPYPLDESFRQALAECGISSTQQGHENGSKTNPEK